MGWLSRTAALALTPICLLLIASAVSSLTRLPLTAAAALVLLLSGIASVALAVACVKLFLRDRAWQVDLLSLISLMGLAGVYLAAGRWFVLRVQQVEGSFGDTPLLHEILLLAIAVLFFTGFSVMLMWFLEAALALAVLFAQLRTTPRFGRRFIIHSRQPTIGKK